MNHIELLRFTLIRYLKRYLNKDDLRIRNVFQIMKHQLEQKQPITKNMFDSVLCFIEREYQFKEYNRRELRKLFNPIVTKTPIQKEPEKKSTLEEFLV